MGRAENRSTLMDNCLEIWEILDFLQLSWPVKACTGIDLALFYHLP